MKRTHHDSAIGALNRAFDEWLTAPEPNAAGRMGIFRIVFCLFYLWHFGRYYAVDFAIWPGLRHRILAVAWIPADLPAAFFVVAESVVVALVVLLLVGYRTRLMTGLVLAAGCFLEAFFVVMDERNSTLFLVFFIPLFMWIGGGWGDTYSLDALTRRARTGKSVPPSTDDGVYLMPVRAVLVVLSALFFSGFVLKTTDGGTWLWYERIMRDLILKGQVDNALAGLPLNPLAPLISNTPVLHSILRYGVLAFEALFWLVLLGPRVRSLVVAMALVFHAANAIWLSVTFSPILVVYLPLVDWESLRRRLLPHGTGRETVRSTRAPVCGSLIAAVGAAVLWHADPGLRELVSLGGLVNEVTIWYPILPLSLALSVVAAFRLVNGLFAGAVRAPA